MVKKLRTIIIGFGEFASGRSYDKKIKKFYNYFSHASILKKHKKFKWDAVVDLNKEARSYARDNFNIPIVTDKIENLPNDYEPDVLVLSTPPKFRNQILNNLKVKKGLLVEKPIAINYADSLEFKDICKKKKIKTQVNFFRRANKNLKKLKNLFLYKIKTIQFGYCLYGRGILNNAIHYIDICRYFFGEVKFVQAHSQFKKINEFTDLSFSLEFSNRQVINFKPINYNLYREVFLDFHGSSGRLEVFREGLMARYYKVIKNISISGYNGIKYEDPMNIRIGDGNEYFNMYTNLANAIFKNKETLSPIESAVENQRIIHNIFLSSENGCKKIKIL